MRFSVIFTSVDYKNIERLWGADRKFCHKGKCSAARWLPSDAEQLHQETEFSIRVDFFIL